MAPYDRNAGGLLDPTPQIIITDHSIGVHSIKQEAGEDEYEVRLLPSPVGSQKKKVEGNKKQKTNGGFKSLWSNKKNKKQQKKSKSTPKKTKKGVKFDDSQNDVQFIPHKTEIAPIQKAILWVNWQDWQTTQNERQRVSRAIAMGVVTPDTPPTDSLLLRGYENLFPHLASKRRENMHSARTLVLREQARARLEGEPTNHDRLAWCYGSITRDSREAAHAQGLADQQQVVEDEGLMPIV